MALRVLGGHIKWHGKIRAVPDPRPGVSCAAELLRWDALGKSVQHMVLRPGPNLPRHKHANRGRLAGHRRPRLTVAGRSEG